MLVSKFRNMLTIINCIVTLFCNLHVFLIETNKLYQLKYLPDSIVHYKQVLILMKNFDKNKNVKRKIMEFLFLI